MLTSFAVQDDLAAQDSGAVEVFLELTNGEKRWCFFMTLAALAASGDFVSGTTVRFHRGAPHMIVVAGHLDRTLIDRILRELAESGEITQCSLPIENPLE